MDLFQGCAKFLIASFLSFPNANELMEAAAFLVLFFSRRLRAFSTKTAGWSEGGWVRGAGKESQQQVLASARRAES